MKMKILIIKEIN